MAITRYAGNRFTGLEVDVKPTNVPDGAKWTDLDGLKRTYIFISGVWEEYIGQAITPVDSVEISGGEIKLVGDVAAPGNNKTYGTDGTGNRVWKDDPASGGVTATTTATLTLTVIGWTANSQTLTVTGVTSTSTNLIVIESIVMGTRWGEAKVFATGQGVDSITFECATTPTEAIDFKVTILK